MFLLKYCQVIKVTYLLNTDLPSVPSLCALSNMDPLNVLTDFILYLT